LISQGHFVFPGEIPCQGNASCFGLILVPPGPYYNWVVCISVGETMVAPEHGAREREEARVASETREIDRDGRERDLLEIEREITR